MFQELIKLEKYARERGFTILSVKPIIKFPLIGVPEFDTKENPFNVLPTEFYLLGIKIKTIGD